MKHRLAFAVLCALAPLAAIAADGARYTAIFGGKNVGHVFVTTEGDTSTVDYDIKNNGRGPTIVETLTLDESGLPRAWTIKGTTTFGSKVDETFERSGADASWVDSTGKGTARVDAPAVYVAQSASPWSDEVYARALLKRPDLGMPALPGGTLRLEKGATIDVDGAGGKLQVTRYDLSGIDTKKEGLAVETSGRCRAKPESVVQEDVLDEEQDEIGGGLNRSAGRDGIWAMENTV